VTRLLRALLVLGLAAGAAGCGDDEATPVSPSVPEELVDADTRVFTGTLGAQESAFYAFTLPQTSGVFVTLASVTGLDTREATATSLQLGLGIPRGTGCALTSSALVTPALVPQIREYTAPGVRCVSVTDPGRLPAPVRFAVRIEYYR
jgi:hypothetical protein